MDLLINGIQYEVRKNTEGSQPQDGQTVSVHYMVSGNYEDLEDGPWLDSSYDREKEFTFILGAGEVIKGVEIAVKNMHVLELCWFRFSSEFAFGERGVPGIIPPNSDIYVALYLMSVQ